ncbi:uncharacterized protein LOC144005299 [Festucalex cinctus]
MMAAVWFLVVLAYALLMGTDARSEGSNVGQKEGAVLDVKSNDVSLEEAFKLLQRLSSALNLQNEAKDDAVSHEDQAPHHNVSQHEDQAPHHNVSQHEDQAPHHNVSQHEDQAPHHNVSQHEDQAPHHNVSQHEDQAPHHNKRP